MKINSRNARRAFVNLFHAGKLSFRAIQNKANDKPWFTARGKGIENIDIAIFNWGVFPVPIWQGTYRCYFKYHEYEYTFYFPRWFHSREYAIINYLENLAQEKWKKNLVNDYALDHLASTYEGYGNQS